MIAVTNPKVHIMSKNQFSYFLKQHEKIQKESTIDWEKQKQEWLAYIDEFYSSLEEWFQPYVDEGSVQYEYNSFELVEDNIGSYEVKEMKIRFAEQSVLVRPVGTLLIGTKGRIDMEGARGRIQFLLADKDSSGIKARVSINEPLPKESPREINWIWKVVLRDSRGIQFEDFTEENFFDALMEIIHV